MNKKHPFKVLGEQWDYLVILDTCRYDYFQKHYKDYLPEGKLSKKISLGTCTNQWLKKNFGEKTDLIYITANPQISSTRPVSRFRASARFEKVYDIWHTDWDEKFHTVKPEVMTQRTLEIIRKYPGKRFIIHYMQPHAPYLTYKDPGDFKYRFQSRIKKRLYNAIILLFSLLGITEPKNRWFVLRKFGLKPLDYMYWMKESLGDNGLRQCYETDLKIVLAEVKKLTENLGGKIVVTADHGEMLGEKGHYAHWGDAGEKHLREVPWFVINKDKKEITKFAKKESKAEKNTPEISKEEIEAKLKMLGYY